MIVVEIKDKHLQRFNSNSKQINDYLTSLNYTLDNVVNSEYIFIHNDLKPRSYF